METVEIPLKKCRLLRTLSFCLLLVAVSSYLWWSPEIISFLGWDDPWPAVLALVLFFSAGLGTVYLLIRLMRRRLGLIIDQHGITEEITEFRMGLIEWQDITSIQPVRVALEPFLMIGVHNPEKYIYRAKSNMSRSLMWANQKAYGAPIAIPTGNLRMKAEEVEQLIALWKREKMA